MLTMAFQMLTMAFEMAFKTKLKKHMPFLITCFMTFEDFTKNMLKAFSKVVERHLLIAFGPFKTHFYKHKKTIALCPPRPQRESA